MPLTAGVRLGPYEINAWIGAGGMGDVYRARDTRLDRVVAVKVLPDHVAASPARRARLDREARAVSRLSHPSICALYDVGDHDGRPFIVMEYLGGETLASRLRRGPLPVAEVVRLGAEIADALDHAHRRGVTHRDLKPANIMLIRGGVKLLDFGIAQLQEAGNPGASAAPAATESLTAEGLIAGTVQYMAPEQLEGRPVDGRTDIFALGAVLHEMATGRPAFEGASKARIIAAILERPTPSVSAAHKAATGSDLDAPFFDDVIARCLARNPDERWQAAGDLCLALKWANTAPARVAGPPRSARRLWLASPVVIAWTALALSGVGTAVWFSTHESAIDPVRPLRWQLTAPAASTFDPSPFSLAVSPDGTHLAFIASSESGDNALWVRPLDSLTARKLADDAAQPFWSADSRSLAFAGGGQLKKVDLATGLVKPLVETLVVSGSWNSAGTLIVALPAGEQRRAGVLYTVPDSGGPLSPVTGLDPARREVRHTNPFFLPDGRRFLFLTRSDDPAYDGMLYVGSLDTAERVALFQSRSRAVYTSGCLVFAKDQQLLAQRFDLSTLRLEGAAVPVGDITSGPNTPFSVSNTGVLAYRMDQQTQLVWFDRNGRSLEAVSQPGYYANPDLSPDGRQVAVSGRDPATGLSDVWILDLERRAPARLTFNGTRERVPLWSPDGARLVYRMGPTLVVKAANGVGPEQQLADRLTNFDNPLDWSLDGQMLLLTSFDSSADTDMWLLPVESGQPRIPLRKTGSRWGVQARISPDGRWLAYASNETGRYEVYVRPFPSGDGRWLITNAGGSEPSWRRDGAELYYLAADGWLMAVPVALTPAFQAGTPLRLFRTGMSTLVNTSFTRNQYVASADGQRFLVTQPTGEPASIVVAVDWVAGLADRR